MKNYYIECDETTSFMEHTYRGGGTKGFAVVDTKDIPTLSKHRWCQSVGGYMVARIGAKVIYMHRFITNFNYTDHKNRDRCDNTRGNLRQACHSSNSTNSSKKKGASSKYKGVYLHNQTGRWVARVRYQYKTHYLGSFTLEVDAAKAYNIKAKELHGEFAHLNEIP
tara:strand:- start:34 stop:531 length:498 start_codon:yes stop_codon:yes gene_type:complete